MYLTTVSGTLQRNWHECSAKTKRYDMTTITDPRPASKFLIVSILFVAAWWASFYHPLVVFMLFLFWWSGVMPVLSTVLIVLYVLLMVHIFLLMVAEAS